MQVYVDFGLHSIFASSLILEHTLGDARFDRDTMYNKTAKHYPFPMRYMVYARIFVAEAAYG